MNIQYRNSAPNVYFFSKNSKSCITENIHLTPTYLFSLGNTQIRAVNKGNKCNPYVPDCATLIEWDRICPHHNV